jgi:hypothetical protein
MSLCEARTQLRVVVQEPLERCAGCFGHGGPFLVLARVELVRSGPDTPGGRSPGGRSGNGPGPTKSLGS